jgi:hypothetical protein
MICELQKIELRHNEKKFQNYSLLLVWEANLTHIGKKMYKKVEKNITRLSDFVGENSAFDVNHHPFTKEALEAKKGIYNGLC